MSTYRKSSLISNKSWVLNIPPYTESKNKHGIETWLAHEVEKYINGQVELRAGIWPWPVPHRINRVLSDKYLKMSTRANIAAKGKDGKWRVIYNHSDGYEAHLGTILREHYRDDDKIQELMDLGDCYFIAPEIADCYAYHRDAGEDRKYNATQVFDTELEALRACNEYYNYKWDGEKWERV